jgi:hypothetical protein
MILLVKGRALALNALTGPSAHVSTVVNPLSRVRSEITAGGSPVRVTGQLNFSSDVPNFWPVKLSGLKISFTGPSDKMSDDF